MILGEGANSTSGRFELKKLRPEQAIALLRPAAENGNAQAAYMLSVIYEGGAGVARDPAAAERWFERAVELDPERVAAQLTQRCRELLQIILLHSEMLAGRTALDPEARNHSDEVCDNAERLRIALEHLAQVAVVAAQSRQQRSA
jgi:TPR repeat protein